MFEEVISVVWNLPPLAYVLVALVTVWYLTTRSHSPDNIPPCPVRPYPILGHIPMLRHDTLGKLKEWKQTAGGIYTLYMGKGLSIIINDYEVMKEAFVKNADYFSDRPHRVVNTDTRFEGEAFLPQPSSSSSSAPCSSNMLKQFTKDLDEEDGVYVEAYLDALSKLNGQLTDVHSLTYAAVSNVICTILIGHRFEFDDASFQKLLYHLAEQSNLLRNTSILTCFPWLKHLPGDLFDAKKALDNEQAFLDLFSIKYVNKIKAEGSTESGQNFITDYLLEEKKKKGAGRATTLDDRHLVRVLSNLFAGGTETTTTIIQWALLFALHHPSIQNKVYQEIVDVAGTDILPSLDDKAKMVYTNAFIMETMRLASIVPLSLPHVCSETTTIAGYTIPKGSTVLPHITAVLHDPKIWGDPLVFRPERFIDENNVLTLPEQFIPFGIGRRLCFGESMGKTELFLFLTGIFQRFHLMPEDPVQLPSLLPVFGLTCPPANYKMRLVPRQN